MTTTTSAFYLVAVIVLLSLRSTDSVTPTHTPTAIPTISPTYAPSKVPSGNAPLPIAIHQLVTVEAGGNAVIKLKGFDMITPQNGLVPKIISPAGSGFLYQLSHSFSNYGYEPKKGMKILTGDQNVTGSNQRVYYERGTSLAASTDKWTSFTFTVTGKAFESFEGTVTVVPPNGNLVGSNFMKGSEMWTVMGNKLASAPVEHVMNSQFGMNYFIAGSDDQISTDTTGGTDSKLWYFHAPPKFTGNQGISYGGHLSFDLAAFSGSFSSLNSAYMVLLHCAECMGPVFKGITLGFPMQSFDGSFKHFKLSLKEDGGWLMDSQNSLKPWTKPTKCNMIQVLSRLTSIKVLGDWTTWYESIAMDNFQISNTQSQLPVCAMSRPDASVCTC